MVPAAIENQITGRTAPMIKAKVVVEGANGPTTTAGDANLASRGIPVVPDILANSGGVIVSFFEWLQNRASEYWELDEVDARLKRQILEAWSNVSRTAKERNIDLRTAAYAVALLRIAEAYRARGVFP
jgi:glutamate dehydrogenase (NAD(P)+)